MGRTTISINAVKPDGKSVKKTISFVASSCRYFFNRQHLTVELSSAEMSFYEYLCEKMDSKNKVLIDKQLKDAYISFIGLVTSNKNFLKVSSLSRYISHLHKTGLIISWGSTNSALYMINPKYAYKGPETKRKELLKKAIEVRIKDGKSIQGFIDEPEFNFLE